MKTENSCYNCPNRRKRATIIAKFTKRGKPSTNARKRKKQKRAERITITSIIEEKTDVHGILRQRMLQI